MDRVELLAEAARLTKIQQDERGKDKNRDKQEILGPYVPTVEREARAIRILDLRKQAGQLEKESRK